MKHIIKIDDDLHIDPEAVIAVARCESDGPETVITLVHGHRIYSDLTPDEVVDTIRAALHGRTESPTPVGWRP